MEDVGGALLHLRFFCVSVFSSMCILILVIWCTEHNKFFILFKTVKGSRGQVQKNRLKLDHQAFLWQVSTCLMNSKILTRVLRVP